jgi:hypothetical protein
MCFIYQPMVWYPPYSGLGAAAIGFPCLWFCLVSFSSQNCKLLLRPNTFPLLRTPDVCKICKLLQCSGCLDSQSSLRALAQVKATGLSCRFCIRSSFFHRHILPQFAGPCSGQGTWRLLQILYSVQLLSQAHLAPVYVLVSSCLGCKSGRAFSSFKAD